MKFCPDCGKPCEGLKFCGECGFDLRPYIPVVDNITPPEQPKPQATATAAVGTAQPAQPAKPQMVTAQKQEQTIPDNIETLLAPFEWKLNDDGKTFTITGVKDKKIQSADIPYGVTVIGERAFYYCESLTSITIPNSVTSIGKQAFYGCRSLTSITVDPSNPTYHSDGNCIIQTATKTLIVGCQNSTIPADGSVTIIGEEAFASLFLTNITIPGCITNIGNKAFDNCQWLTSVTLHNGVASIGEWAFCNCQRLTSVSLPNSVTNIGAWAFHSCASLTSISFPNSDINIGDYAFSACPRLKKVCISKHAQINENAFPTACQIIRT